MEREVVDHVPKGVQREKARNPYVRDELADILGKIQALPRTSF